MSAHAMSLPAALWTLAFFLVGGAAAQDRGPGNIPALRAEKKLDDGWYQIAMAWGALHFSFQLPRAPKYRTGSGVHNWFVQFDVEEAYQGQMSSFRRDFDVTNPRRLIQKSLDADAKMLEGGKFESVDWREYQGNNNQIITAAEAVGRTFSGHHMRVYSAMKGPWVFALIYVGPAGSAHSANVNRFIESVRIYQRADLRFSARFPVVANTSLEPLRKRGRSWRVYC